MSIIDIIKIGPQYNKNKTVNKHQGAVYISNWMRKFIYPMIYISERGSIIRRLD